MLTLVNLGEPRGVIQQKQVNKGSAGTLGEYVRDRYGDGDGWKEDPQKWGQSQMDGKAYREILKCVFEKQNMYEC